MNRRTALKDTASETQLFSTRVIVALVCIVMLLLLLMARLAYLQVVNQAHFTTLSEKNRQRLVPEAPTRGLIYDRNGLLLAENLPSYTLVLVPEQVEDMARTLDELGELITISEIDRQRFDRQLKQSRRFNAVPLRFRLSDEEVAVFAVNRHRFPGVDIEARLLRHYPQESLAVHAIGYVGRISEADLRRIDASRYAATDYIGKTGIERIYEDILLGEVGYQQVETNAQGRMLRVLERTPPQPGKNLYLSIDAQMQAIAEAALGEQRGAVVAIDPRNGEVLVLASLPGFDPNLFVTGIDAEQYALLQDPRDRPLFNRAVRGRYPPGSTLKPFFGLAALDQRITDLHTRKFCPGWFTLEGQEHKYRDWKKEGHGFTTLDKAIIESCDVFFYELGIELGITRMHEFLTRFGFNGTTGIDLDGELPSQMPSPQWKRATLNEGWYLGETLITAIGQGFTLATPLQLSSLTATLASRGQRLAPRLLQRVEDGLSGEQQPTEVLPLGQVQLTDPANWDKIIGSMMRVAHTPRGTAYGIGRDAPYKLAGKTGTAQVFGIAQDQKYEKEKVAEVLRDHALFISFAPVDEPRIAVAVIVENGGGGGSVAAPIARRIMDYYLGNPS